MHEKGVEEIMQFPSLHKYVQEMGEIIRKIYDDHPNDPQTAQDKIRRLQGIPQSKMQNILESTYETGFDLDPDLAKYLSPKRKARMHTDQFSKEEIK